jgi:hypothetical protein
MIKRLRIKVYKNRYWRWVCVDEKLQAKLVYNFLDLTENSCGKCNHLPFHYPASKALCEAIANPTSTLD